MCIQYGKFKFLPKFKNEQNIPDEIENDSFGSLYLAENVEEKGTKTVYILKILKDEKEKEITKKEFNKEIKILKKFPKNNHTPHIYESKEYTVLDDTITKKEEKPYYVIDFFSHSCLHFYKFFTGKPPENRSVKLMFKKIVKGVEFLHNNCICHLDLKPENIVLDKQFDPYIIDFGSAEEFKKGEEKITIDEDTPKGTFSYNSPEIYKKNEEINGVKADIFSLGIILFELVTGDDAFIVANANSDFLNQFNSEKDTTKKRRLVLKKKEELPINNIYDLIKNKSEEDNICPKYWEKLEEIYELKGNDIILELSNNFKDLFIRMVTFDPLKRPSINEILSHPWLQEVNLPENEKDKIEELDKLEKEFRQVFCDIYNKLTNSNCEENKLAKKYKKEGWKTRAETLDEKDKIFNDPNINIKTILDDSIHANLFINIFGFFQNFEVDFMNILADKIKSDLRGKCEAIGGSLSFNAYFDESIIKIELFKHSKGNLIEFGRIGGEIRDYYHYFLEIKKIIKNELKLFTDE